ncbi:MAG: head morphogenesis protein [Myxococcales bacterium]|nr:head morphogenesis protein [Myxococcales bacterium]
MCRPPPSAGRVCEAADLLLVSKAKRAAEVVLGGILRLPVAKVTDLSTPAGFDQAVAVLAAKLRRAASGAEAAAVREAIRALDVDWRRTSASDRSRLVAAALAAARRATAAVPPRIEVPLSAAANSIVAATRDHARRAERLSIRAEFNALDRRITAHIVSSQGNFVRDEYGRRVDAFGASARQIVASGVDQGLGRADIGQALQAAARAELIERAPFYWEVVAAAFTGQGRSFAQLSAYAEAGIKRYQIEAVLDEATTPICRYLHGKSFAVAEAVSRFERVEHLSSPEDIKRELPWVRQARHEPTGRTRLYVDGRAGRVDLAEMKGEGASAFRALVSDQALSDLGVGFPPYHGLCRTVVVSTSR